MCSFVVFLIVLVVWRFGGGVLVLFRRGRECLQLRHALEVHDLGNSEARRWGKLISGICADDVVFTTVVERRKQGK